MLDDIFSTIISDVSPKKEATIKNIKFEIRPLTFEEEQNINSYPEEGENPVTFYDRAKIKVLSYAIISINGKVIPDIVETRVKDENVTKEKSLYLVDKLGKLPSKITDKLFDIYNDFKEEVEVEISENIKFDWFKTPEEREKEKKNKINKYEESEEASENEESKDNPEDTEEDSKEEDNDIVLKKVDIQE